MWELGLPGSPCLSHQAVNVGLLVLHRKCEPLEWALLLVHLAAWGMQTALQFEKVTDFLKH